MMMLLSDALGAKQTFGVANSACASDTVERANCYVNVFCGE